MRCKLILPLLLASAVILAVGAPVPRSSARLDSGAKSIAPESGKASIYVYRRGFTGSALVLQVVLDGHVVGFLPHNGSMQLKVAPGQHSVTVMPNYKFGSDVKQSRTVLAEAGRSYFYKVTIHVGLSKPHLRLQAMNERVGSREVARSKRAESFAAEYARLAAQRKQAAEKKQAEERAFWSSHEARMSTNNPDIGIVVPKGTPKDVTPENLSNDLLNLLLEQKVSIIEIKLFGRTISPVAAFTMTTQGLVLMERPGIMSFLVAPGCRFIDIRRTGGTFALLTKSQEENAVATAKSNGCAKPTQPLQANSTPTRQLGAPQESKVNQQILTPTPAAPHTSGSAIRPHVTVLLDSTALSRIKSLPPNVVFFTSKKDPIKRLSDITDPQSQVAVWARHDGCKGGLSMQELGANAILSGAIAPLTGVVTGVHTHTTANSTVTTMQLGPGAYHAICSDSFGGLFQDFPHLRLFVTLRDIPGVNLIETTGGGIGVVFTESRPAQPLRANSTPTKQLVASQESKASQQVSTPAAPRETFSQFLQAGKTYEQQGDQARNEVVKASARGGSTAGPIDKEVRLYQQAIDSYTKAISIDPQSGQALILRGMVYAKRDQDEKQSFVTQSSGGGMPTVSLRSLGFGPPRSRRDTREKTYKKRLTHAAPFIDAPPAGG